MQHREVYLDNAATTKPHREVIKYIDEINIKNYGNPSSLHMKGIEAERIIKDSKQIISKSLNTQPGNIIFTASGTEANNIAILGYLKANRRAGNHIVTLKTEHPSIFNIYKHLENEGYDVDYIEVDKKGKADLDQLRNAVTENTILVSIMMVNSETGFIHKPSEISYIIKKKNSNTAFHTDCVQSYGKYKISPETDNIDLLTISAHKIHGPKGSGALYKRKGLKLLPLLYGGGQEDALRPGTENVSAIAGFGLAAHIMNNDINSNYTHVQGLNKILKNELLSLNNIKVISPEDASPYILSVSFEGIKAEVLLHHLERYGIYVSTGSACSSRNKHRSYVLTSMGINPKVIDGVIRFSLSIDNTEDEIIYTIHTLKDVITSLRQV